MVAPVTETGLAGPRTFETTTFHWAGENLRGALDSTFWGMDQTEFGMNSLASRIRCVGRESKVSLPALTRAFASCKRSIGSSTSVGSSAKNMKTWLAQ